MRIPALLLCFSLVLIGCEPPVCGDGVTNGTDECDDGNQTPNDACDPGCLLPRCGNGVLGKDGPELLNPIEECDDGNVLSGDGCSDQCISEVCGNNVVDVGEECDDGNGVNTDSCTDACEDATCGDGFLQTLNNEECDDGNQNNNDDCLDTCEDATCGDGFTLIDVEECDDGAQNNNDGCSSSCLREASQVSAGGSHTCALLDTGNVRCWGFGSLLGYGNTNSIGDNETPASAGNVNVGGTVVQIAAGGGHTCALLDTGNVRCWGNSNNGQLGYGNTTAIGDNETPDSIGDVSVGGNVLQISTGASHTCALLTTGNVRCWGAGSLLGYANTITIGDDEPPSSVSNVPIGGSVAQISTGDSHTCALLTTGSVRCWGDGFFGRLGYGNTNSIGDNETPASAGNVNVGGAVEQISAGGSHTCALLDNGNVRCWGNNNFGRLGYGNTNRIGDNETPASAGNVNVGGTVVQIAAGGGHTCALLDTGNVRCWGDGSFGQLGYGNFNDIGDDEPPSNAGDVNVDASVLQISTGASHTCALLTTGNVRCWGESSVGQLGYGNTNDIGDTESPVSAGDIDLF